MIVDVETHIWDSPRRLGPELAAALRRGAALPFNRPEGSTTSHEMAMEPVEHALVLGLTAKRLGAEIPAAFMAEYVGRRPDKYTGFAGIDPTDEEWSEQLEVALALGLQGVTVSPALAGFAPTDERAMPLYQRCQEEHLPLVVLAGADRCPQAMMEFGSAALLDPVLRMFPQLRVVIGQMGDPWVELTLALLAKHPQIYASVAGMADRPGQLQQALRLAYERGVMGQLLLGSGFPWSTPERAIHAVLQAGGTGGGSSLAPIPLCELENIVKRDSLSCLGLTPAAITDRGLMTPSTLV